MGQRGAPLAGSGTWPRPTGSAPGPRQGECPWHCEQRSCRERLGDWSPQTLRGGRAPSLGQSRRATALRSSPAASSASRLRLEGQRLPGPGAAPLPRPVRTPRRFPNPPRAELGFRSRDPGRAAGNPRNRWKVSREAAKPPRRPPSPCTPGGPRLRVLAVGAQSPTCFRGPLGAWPASHAILCSRAQATPERRARSQSCEQPRAGRRAAGGGHRARRASEQAGGRLEQRCCC